MTTANKSLRKFLFAASLGTFLEFFDVALYSFCSALIAKYFFPASVTDSAVILTWVVFAISCLARPLGALWFGYIADASSSKLAMILSMALMAIATCGIGLLPTYAAIGLWAPLGLLMLRIMQSIAVSPEYNLPSVFIKNNCWCEKHYGFVSSISAAVTGLGMLSASWIMGAILAEHDVADIAQYQWRLPFIIAGLLVGTIGIYLRWNIDETLISKPKTVPIKQVWQKQRFDLLGGVFIAGYIGIITYALFSFLIHQLQSVRGMTPGAALEVLGHGTFVLAGFSLLAGFCSDYVPRNILMLLSAVVILVSGVFLFNNIVALSHSSLVLQTLIMLAGLGFFAGGFPGYLAELFAKEYRYTGSFLAYNIGISWIGGTSPLMFIGLNKLHHGLPLVLIVSYSILVIALLCKPLVAFVFRQSDVV